VEQAASAAMPSNTNFRLLLPIANYSGLAFDGQVKHRIFGRGELVSGENSPGQEPSIG
jgi:hypothetical protein